MNTPMIGINAINGIRPEELEHAVKTVAEFGFDCMEFNLSSVPLIVGGQVCPRMVEYVKEIFEKFPLKYTGHIGGGLNLRDLQEHDLHRAVLKSSIDICQMLGIDRLTLHFENASPIEREEKVFFDAHVEAADYAKDKGVLLLIENIEIEDYRKVIDMVRRVDRDNFKMTLDIGHLNLSTRYFGGDFKQAVRECAPYVRHLHMSDNTGRFEKMRLENFAMYKTLNMGVRIAFGAGDIHLPPLWGDIPTRFVIETLKEHDYSGIFLCEYENELYIPFGKDIQQEVRAAVNDVYGQ